MRTKDELKNHPQVIDLTGQVFNRLTVKEFAGVRSGNSQWKCKCSCGNEAVVQGGNLKSGASKSCGCFSIEGVRKLGLASKTHGGYGSYLYNLWTRIHQRCGNPRCPDYPRYGGRGITTHPDFDTFEGFQEYILRNLGHRKLGHSLDRTDNDGNYEPGNLRWATREEQGRNTRANVIVEVFGEAISLAEAVEKWGKVCRSTTRYRLSLGWPIEEALLAPAGKKRTPFSK